MTEITPTRGDREELTRLEREDLHARRRTRLIIALIFLIAIPLAVWTGSLLNHAEDATTQAKQKVEQVQDEKFNLAKQIAASCASPDGLDEVTARRLCSDARTIVQEGPQGAQGVPGVQGVQGIPGVQGVIGVPGAQGPRGLPGMPGSDGAAGANGVDGTNGIDGAPGVDGAPGLNGLDGPAGPAGEAGARGPAGPPGPAGADGPAGPQGEPGKDGAIGPRGPKGAAGKPPFSWTVFDENGAVIEKCVRHDDFNEDEPRYVCTRM